MEIVNKLTEETFSLTGEYIEKDIEGVEVLKYLRRMLNHSDDNCP